MVVVGVVVGVVGVVVVYIVVVSSMTWCAKDNITLSLISLMHNYMKLVSK